MTSSQANNLANYDVIVIDYENFINNPKSVDILKLNNPKIKLIIYLNQTEIFEPMWSDKPWSIQLLKELNQRPEWWLRQPDGNKLGAWKGMYALDMRDNCPVVNGEKYWQFIAKKYLSILKDKRIDGCLIDNCWGDNETGITWLSNYRGQKGFDFNNDGLPDRNFKEINQSWTNGMKKYIKAIRQAKGEDFIIIANPGNDSFHEVDAKQFETFPYPYHDINEENDWLVNMKIATKFKMALINPEKQNYFLGLCSSVMLDNLIFFNDQNTSYTSDYDLKLGDPIGKMKRFPENIFCRKFTNGTVYVRNGNEAWISYKDGTVRRK